MEGEAHRAEARHALVRRMGAAAAWLLDADLEEVEPLLGLPECYCRIVVLGGTPLACADVRAMGRDCRERGIALVADNRMAGLEACAPVRLGAHVSLEEPVAGVTLVGISRDAGRVLPGIGSPLDAFPQADVACWSRIVEEMSGRERRWRVVSDAAQVIASFLACHPRVAEIHYPGLREDPSFEVAARTLVGGFGPSIDYRLHGEAEYRRLDATEDDVRDQVMRVEDLLAAG